MPTKAGLIWKYDGQMSPLKRRLKLRLYLYLTFATYWCIDFFQPYIFLAMESESMHPRAGHVYGDLGSSAGLLFDLGRVAMKNWESLLVLSMNVAMCSSSG